jgi:peroxiredoxin Q/BCP
MIGVGDRAPNFDVPTGDGSHVHLADLLASGPVVAFFYPKDQKSNSGLHRRGVLVSRCVRRVYRPWCPGRRDQFGLSRVACRLCASLSAAVSAYQRRRWKAAQSVRRAKALGLLPGRVTYVIDRAGVVRSVFNSMFEPQKHVAAALEVLKALV